MYLDYLEYGLPIMRQKIEKEIEKLSNENKEKKEQPQK
jgi:hypothetical protein